MHGKAQALHVSMHRIRGEKAVMHSGTLAHFVNLTGWAKVWGCGCFNFKTWSGFSDFPER